MIISANSEYALTKSFIIFIGSASVGGIFGLCLGASTISLIEMIYFVVIRIFGRILVYSLNIPPKIQPKQQQLDTKNKRKRLHVQNRRVYSNVEHQSKALNALTKQYIN